MRTDCPLLPRYYEQLEEITAKMPDDVLQHYDVFIHVYVATPVGQRRVGEILLCTK